MLLILASRGDAEARDLAADWCSAPARVLTCADLAVTGWNWWCGRPGLTRVVVDGEIHRGAAIRGVLVRLPAITESELPHITPTDRSFVAAELTAFLVAWLKTLSCPVINRPAPLSLGGPAWLPDRWFLEACRLGIPTVDSFHRLGAGIGPTLPTQFPEACTTTVVGKKCFGASTAEVRDHTLRLAEVAGVSLLSARFVKCPDGLAFAEAVLHPRLDLPEVRAALLGLLFGTPSV